MTLDPLPRPRLGPGFPLRDTAGLNEVIPTGFSHDQPVDSSERLRGSPRPPADVCFSAFVSAKPVAVPSSHRHLAAGQRLTRAGTHRHEATSLCVARVLPADGRHPPCECRRLHEPQTTHRKWTWRKQPRSSVGAGPPAGSLTVQPPRRAGARSASPPRPACSEGDGEPVPAVAQLPATSETWTCVLPPAARPEPGPATPAPWSLGSPRPARGDGQTCLAPLTRLLRGRTPGRVPSALNGQVLCVRRAAHACGFQDTLASLILELLPRAR